MSHNKSWGLRLIRPLVTAAGVMLALMTLYEWLKHFFIPNISIWGSYSITIAFTTLMAVVTFYCIMKHFYGEYDNRLQEIALREATEAQLRQSEAKWQGLSRTGRRMDLRGIHDRHYGPQAHGS